MIAFRRYGELVMFSHSIFSFSFTVLALLTAFRGDFDPFDAVLVVVAFLGGRTCANALNRVIDRRIDAANPRTAGRHIPAGLVGSGEALALAGISFAFLAVSAFLLNPVCAALLPVAGILFVLYSYTKRFTWLCHGVLGIVCSGATVGAWLAVRGRIDWPVLLLASSNAAWVAGFDVVYAIQDIEFDRAQGLFSVPARFGSRLSLLLAGGAHAFAVAALASFGYAVGLGPAFLVSVLLIAATLVWALFSAWKDYQRTALFASYSANQVVSFILLVGTAVEFGFLRTVPSWRSLTELVEGLAGVLS